ncbi:hypothetical protein B7R22_07585 [Subtercola boreus]|uniref:Uncharacterized protein n=1 Tax=Subtercola boreus TaxID=120213 RepID=A0A3E0VZR2_9MICO|nr:hypothetical protein [Subtercola boreus]RFA14989.1 hypothetical protein B7R22_07585 [Subtercola boreus]
MTVVFDGTVFTSYGQLHLVSGDEEPPPPDGAFFRQANGLCGAAVPGALFLVTGTHTGDIPVRVVVTDAEPALGEWEEIVEVSFTPEGTSAAFLGWAGDPVAGFEAPAPCYRARWSASGMDAGKQQDVADAQDPAPDAYELALWPAPGAADRIARRTGSVAGEWHDGGFDRSEPPPA